MSAIWASSFGPEDLNGMSKNTIAEFLDIEVIEVGDDFLKARMPVTAKTHQPMGVLHGGASVVLAESIGSIAANCCLDNTKEYAVGQEINANHLRPISSGYVYATTTPVHIGRRSHVWRIQIEDEQSKAICESRITMAVMQY